MIHWCLPVGMPPDEVNKRYGFVVGLQFVLQRSYLICKLVTILSKIELNVFIEWLVETNEGRICCCKMMKQFRYDMEVS